MSPLSYAGLKLILQEIACSKNKFNSAGRRGLGLSPNYRLT